jgi:hypothetical protein
MERKDIDPYNEEIWEEDLKPIKKCYADEDGVTHAMCASHYSCDKCSCYRIKIK